MLVWSTYKPSTALISIDVFIWRRYNHSNYRKPQENINNFSIPMDTQRNSVAILLTSISEQSDLTFWSSVKLKGGGLAVGATRNVF